MACEDYVYNLEAIETFIGMKIPTGVANDDSFEKSKSQGMVFDVKGKRAPRGDRFTEKHRQKTPYTRKSGSENRGKRDDRDDRKKEDIPKKEDNKARNLEYKKEAGSESHSNQRNKQNTQNTQNRRNDRNNHNERNDRNKRNDFDRRGQDKNIAKEKPKSVTHNDAGRNDYSSKKKSQGSQGRRDERRDNHRDGHKENRRDEQRNQKDKSYRQNRLEYYKKKYGDNFKSPGDEILSSKNPKTAHAKQAAQNAKPGENKNIPAQGISESKQSVESKKSLLAKIKSFFKKQD
ncbi:MAG: hypothetical protein MUF15_22215, partial [Acidobacteria bacterium]|jgi:hypothetical protein|nr:hypothetical protein [Acidobacteriota bacterium]